MVIIIWLRDNWNCRSLTRLTGRYHLYQIDLTEHLIGLPETMLQTLLFSVLLFKWTQYRRQYLTTISVMAVLLIVLMSVLGVLDSKGFTL